MESTDHVAPLLGSNGAINADSSRSLAPGHRRAVHGAARYLRQATGRRPMREPSMLVRQTAAEQLEERQSDWAYSRPVVVLDLMWNLAFVVVAVAVLVNSKEERPETPLRVWIVGYAVQCLVHMVCVCSEYRRRRRRILRGGSGPAENTVGHLSAGSESEIDMEAQSSEEESLVEQVRLSVVFLAFDVFFVVFCVALACVIGIAKEIFFTFQEGASEEDINLIPRFKFRRSGSIDTCIIEKADKAPSLGGIMALVGSSDPSSERGLSSEDAVRQSFLFGKDLTISMDQECCICLSPYDDGVELRELPCNHHFHCSCIDKWLRINATCPLCKFNIIHNSSERRDDG
ncbi:E3 ubiquitin-protein ligase At4g11680 [Selaginella moellendorffii]|uniref:E3 ubiquitin-protein ligase At4g11680 n=1 Tax=Selaginella moellendorffii TaxID=88036 RepID=UPI000D1CDCC0|nr:E3 ubiquitin-protein ligase At4g11680 [Selaginella moellendorffii]|eukprot:XP_024541036.1 E3 ubiquitin-protein ligase At4g11680 [Selaginella moellendorffii]